VEPIVYRCHHSRNLRIAAGKGQWCNFSNFHFTATEEWEKEAIEKSQSFTDRAVIALPDVPEEVARQDPLLRRAMKLPPPETPKVDASPVATQEEQEAYPVQRGDGFWELSNGEIVRGRDAAIIRERIIARNPE